MNLEVTDNKVLYANGSLDVAYTVLEAREIDETIIVVYDYMEFPKGEPSRNLFAYNKSGEELWRSEDIKMGATDAYTNVISESPLIVGNFSGFNVKIDMLSGKILDKVFTK